MAMTYKIFEAGKDVPVLGTEHFTTLDECEDWLAENQVFYEDEDPEKPHPDGSKYILYTEEV